jgi:hypothetical protein
MFVYITNLSSTFSSSPWSYVDSGELTYRMSEIHTIGDLHCCFILSLFEDAYSIQKLYYTGWEGIIKYKLYEFKYTTKYRAPLTVHFNKCNIILDWFLLFAGYQSSTAMHTKNLITEQPIDTSQR